MTRLAAGVEARIVRLSTHCGPLTMATMALGLAAAWLVTYVGGGTHTALPHLFYVPVVLAASRFRERGALVVALAAGLMAGPLMPLDVDAGTMQEPLGWLMRTVFFVLIGQTTALLCHRSMATLSAVMADNRIRSELQRGLANGELRLAYQPQFRLTTGALVGFEALLRWVKADGTMISPDVFIADAERTGMIADIGELVLREATAQLAVWRSAPGASTLKMAVNVSAHQLEDDGVLTHVAAALHDAGIPASALQLEVTESALITDLSAVSGRLEQLRALGVSVAIDDFGTGQSSLTYLHRLHVDVIKIDRAFVDGLERDAHTRAVARGVVRLAVGLGATTVAEGIENQEQAQTLLRLGCEFGQGFHYGRALEPTDAGALLENELGAPELARWSDGGAPSQTAQVATG